MTTDSRLLQSCVADGSEAACDELVQRHLNLVHSAALCLVGYNARLAKDAAQAVVIALAHRCQWRSALKIDE